MSSTVSATASDQRKPCRAKNLMCEEYLPMAPAETSSQVRKSRGLTMILGPETPWAGED